MNAGIVTSFIIGGLLLLSVFQMNLTIRNSATKTTLQSLAKDKMQPISETISYDIKKMGVGSNFRNSVIRDNSDSTQIIFERTANGSVQNFSWRSYPSSDYSSSKNPNDYRLVRTAPDPSGGGTQTNTYAVNNFKVTYILMSGTETKDPTSDQLDDTIGIKIEAGTASGQGLKRQNDDSKFYGKSFWHTTIYPANLNILRKN